jgi:hypothetical protein
MPGRPRLHPRHRRRDRLNIGAGWGQAVRGFYAVKYIYTTLYDLYVAPLLPLQFRDPVPFHADWPC